MRLRDAGIDEIFDAALFELQELNRGWVRAARVVLGALYGGFRALLLLTIRASRRYSDRLLIRHCRHLARRCRGIE